MAELRRQLGAWSAAAIVVGTVIGSGIFLVPKAMIQQVGSPDMVLLAWVAGGLLSLAGALTYAELAAALPQAGGEYVYLKEAYGPFFGFLYGWTQMWVAKSGSIAALATAFFYYLANFFPGLEATFAWLPAPLGEGGGPLEIRYGQLLAIGVIAGLAWINYWGLKAGAGVQVAVTAAKVAAIAAIIAIGLGSSKGDTANLASSVEAPGGVSGLFAALVAVLWAYDGWNNVTMVGGEVRRPQRNLPLALAAGTGGVILLYLAVNLAYFYVLPSAEVASSDRVAAAMMGRVFGEWGAAAVSLAALISILGALNGSLLTGARIPYAMGRDRLFLQRAGRVHPHHHTPSFALGILSVWSAVLVLSGRFEQLFTYVIFGSLILYAMTAASVIVLRYKRPLLARPYLTIGYPVVPVLFVLGTVALIGNTLVQSPRESVFGLGLILAGLPFYFYWKARG